VDAIMTADTAKQVEQILDKHKGRFDIDFVLEGNYLTALGCCVAVGRADKAAVVLRRGADVNKYSSTPQHRPLWWAAGFAKSAETVRLLLDYGASVNQDGGMGTALHGVTNLDVARVLLERGADPSLRNKEGKSAFDMAAEGKDDGVLALFKEFAAKPAGELRAVSAG
jgi:ankyrin repeat protein